MQTFTTAVTPEQNLTSIDAAKLLPDKVTRPNATWEDKVQWDNQTAVHELFQQWMRFENLPPKWSMFVGLVHVISALTSILLRYPLWQVIGTMAIVEAPETVFRNDRRRSDNEKQNDNFEDSTIITQQRPSTCSVRNALRHIHRIGGFTAFYRGTAISICYSWVFGIMYVVCFGGVSKLVSTSGKMGTVVDFTVSLICNLLLCQWATAHTHILITPPTLRIWYRRLPPFWRTLKSTWLLKVLGALAQKTTFALPYFMCRKAGLYDRNSYLGSEATGNAIYLRQFTFVVIWLAAQVARIELLIPTGIALIRVETSLLSEDEDTIVPVDRTFSAKASGQGSGFTPPGILAPSRGAISTKTAWRSYDRADRRRILLLYAKFVVVEAVTKAVFWTVIGNDVWPRFWHPEL